MRVMFIRLGLGAAIVFPFYIVLRLLYLQRKRAKPEVLREILLCFFVLFMGGLFVLVLWPGNLTGQSANHFLRVLERLRTGSGMNLVPLYTIRSYFTDSVGTRFIINIVANVLMFSPMGLCLPLFWRRFQKWWKLLCIGTAFSAGIETVQLFVGRSVDIDDIILNVAGVMLGYVVFALLVRFVPNVMCKNHCTNI
ncbi:MAG: VanZ family protein [Lachnospiraceae bacterium]